MELYSHERTPGVSYARIAYHYGRPGLIDDHVGLTDEDVRPLKLPPNWQPAARMGARASVFFQAEDLLSEDASTSLVRDPLWAGGQVLIWSPTNSLDELPFTLPVPESGNYVIHVTAAKTPLSGRFSATLDGEPLRFTTEDGTVDLRTDYRVLSRTFSAQSKMLDAGDHNLTLRALEREGQKVQDPIGIDFFWLQRR
jgi:hypothetical protein